MSEVHVPKVEGCLCIFDANDDPDDHPVWEAVCSNPACSDDPPAPRTCSMSDCVCWANSSGTCAHCSHPAELRPVAA
jgi:hypothetical protein